jgi:UrcA family protein
MTRKTLAVLAATLTFALPASALAGSHDMKVTVDGQAGTETRSIVVSLADLNLASGHGARLANSRITRAAEQACGWMRGSVQQPSREYRACFSKALDGARGDLNSLVAQHQG